MLHRSAVAIAAVLVAATAVACTVGEFPNGGDDVGGTPDSRVTGGGVDADPNCLPAVVGGGGLGHHNAGTSCITANCHGTPPGPLAPQYSIAGTLYTDALGGAGIDGATIIVTDANNVTINITTRGTGGVGNFYSENLTLVPPFTVQATQCPSLQSMGTPADSGNCNSCHITGGTANARIHL
jgi:hypothetical protein